MSESNSEETAEMLIKRALEETRKLIADLPEELFILRKRDAAARELAAAYRETGDSERTQAALKKYEEVANG